jgi:hypothetical protein
MLVGQKKKSLSDQPAFCAAELKELFDGMEEVVNSSTPPEIPAAVAVGHLVRMAATLKQYHTIVSRMAIVNLDNDPPVDGADDPLLLKVAADLLLKADAPKESRIVMPSQLGM